MPSAMQRVTTHASTFALVATLTFGATAGMAAPKATSGAAPVGALTSGAIAWTEQPVANWSFTQGRRHWRAPGAHDYLTRSRHGHRDRHAVVLRTSARGSAQLASSGPLVGSTAQGAIYRFSVWVKSRSRGVPVALSVTEMGVRTNTSGQVVATARGNRWRKIEMDYTPLETSSTVWLTVGSSDLGRRQRVVIDDVRLRVSRSPDPVPVPDPVPAPDPTWLSGASGDGISDGTFADWRGRPVAIAGTWNTNFASHEAQWSLRPGFAFGAWQGHVDDAVGAIYKDRGETWARAAQGAYDARWRRMLVNLANSWRGRPGTLYLRFAHEFNGDWQPWSVTAGEAEDFKSSWRRFRALQQEILPAAKMVFCPNIRTAQKSDLDWRLAFPGKAYVDVESVDYYNQYPFVASDASFRSVSRGSDKFGAPGGLEKHREFAENTGLPFAISEWSSNADLGDSPHFVSSLHSWMSAHAGVGPGRMLYEIEFNVGSYGGGNFQMFPRSRQPQAASMYQHLW